jgi:hypothetical protein
MQVERAAYCEQIARMYAAQSIHDARGAHIGDRARDSLQRRAQAVGEMRAVLRPAREQPLVRTEPQRARQQSGSTAARFDRKREIGDALHRLAESAVVGIATHIDTDRHCNFGHPQPRRFDVPGGFSHGAAPRHRRRSAAP